MPIWKVETNIPYGNAGDVALDEDAGGVVVAFASDPHGGPECLWFCFRVRRVDCAPRRGRKIKVLWKNFQNVLGAGKAETIRPVFRADNGSWERLPAGTHVELPDGRREIAWLLDEPIRQVELAFCYPYGAAEVKRLVEETAGYWRADVVGLSQNGRPLTRLSNDYGDKSRVRPGLYLAARQHSGETPGSWVLDGFLRQIAASGEKAPLVWAIPLANIDGVEQGDYGKDNFPCDLNRAWGNPPMRHETLVIQRDIQNWAKRCRPALGVDFHAPGAWEDSGVYAFVPDPEKFPDQHPRLAPWLDVFNQALSGGYAAESFARVANYPSRWEMPTLSRYFFRISEMTGISLETPYALCGQTLLTPKEYQEIGARLAAAVVERLGNK